MTEVRPAHAIFLNGSYGIGKSTLLEHLGDQLAAAGTPFALMDVDWFHRSWPPAPHDPSNVVVEAENIAAVWAAYQRGGPRQLVLAGVIETAEDRARYERATGLAVRSVRLEADPGVREARLRRRYTSAQHAALQWHLARHETLAQRLRAADLDELVVQTDDLQPHVLAQEVLEHFTR
ncbi:hypothetical protein SAMN06264364_1193 [Quadrisphaera granulorum]|uniref:AAA domain-containing protein n=1 Tax=Quadrisphaera granulorum TaxID=317664 RepID=A0A316A3N8_9ACTN|nr:hypothetical protein [Quadrisphaera granulorum]PWJ52511.1 hypothetical protein BXY45_1193 [Quadrisphaera granulorum]SZE97561.1 hypothetical protein SAMN06264364_1193 [Quadrisphaera granulorum]